MKKFIKILITFVIIIAFVIATGAFLITHFVNQDAIKTHLSQLVHDKTGRELTIKGDIGWSFFPWLGVKIGDVTLSNAADFKGGDFAVAHEIDVKVRLMPLFSGKVEADHLVIQGLQLSLVKNSFGADNWHDLLSASTTPSSGSATDNAALSQMIIGSVDINNGQIAWQNQQTNKSVTLTNVHLRSSKIKLGEAFPIYLDLNFANADPTLTGNIDATAKVTLDLNHKLYLVRDFDIKGKLQGQSFTQPVSFNAAASLTADLNQQSLKVDDLRVGLANANAIGSLQGLSIIDAPHFIGSLTINEFNPTSLLQLFGLKSAATWDRAAFKLQFETTSKFLKLPLIEAKLGDMVLQGNGSYSHFDDKNVVFNLALNKLDIDKLMAVDFAMPAKAASPVNSKLATASVPSPSSAASSPFELLRAMKLNGDLKIASLRLKNMDLSNLSAQVIANHGLINCTPIAFSLYQGNVSGSAAIDLRNAVPQFGVRLAINKVALHSLLVAAANYDKFNGTLHVSTNVSMRGKNADAILATLNGSTEVAIENGVYKGVDIPFEVRRAGAVINQKPVPPTPAVAQTEFTRLTSSLKINNGIINTNDLLVQAPDYKVTGHGSANAVTQQLDLQVSANSLHDANIFVPIKISGSFTSPSVQPDLSALAQHVLQDTVRKQIKKQLEKQVEKQLQGKELPKELLNVLPIDQLIH